MTKKNQDTAVKSAIERLRASADKQSEKETMDGAKAGREWAINFAEAADLELLDDVTDETEWPFDCDDAYTDGENLYFTINADKKGDTGAAEMFWREILGDDTRLSKRMLFVQAFADAAVGFWREVQEDVFATASKA